MISAEGRARSSWRDWFIYIVLAFLVVFFTILRPSFFSLANFGNVARQVSMVAIMAFGMTFVITTANIDLSVGSVVSLVSVMSAFALSWGFGLIGSSLVGIAVGVLISFITGIIVTKAKIPSFLVTLGMLGIARGTALTITGTKAVNIYDAVFKSFWGAGAITFIPTALIWVIIALLISVLLYKYTIFGNHVKATGGNITAAQFSGINTDFVIVRSFVVLGACTAIAGLMMTSRIGEGRPDIASGMELDVIAAVILGGTSLFGGKGSIVTTFVGALIMTVITNGLIILGVGYSVQLIIKGVIIVAAVSLAEKK
ncbi:MAG: ABC transporter permease [Spirochaetia bacterium]|jgi:ribose transport system permease protein